MSDSDLYKKMLCFYEMLYSLSVNDVVCKGQRYTACINYPPSENIQGAEKNLILFL